MKLETFFNKFDQFADAPDAVAKMRELILDFAIGGRLLRTSDNGDLHADGEWPRQTLGSIASLITKGSTPTSYGHQYQASGIPFVKVENITDGVINHSSMEQFISEETHEFLKRSQLEPGDILFSIAGTIGKTCVVRAGDIPANTNQALAIIRGFGASFEIPFLKMQLDSFVANKVKAKARGGAMPNVSLGDLRDLLVVIPPLAEQKRIVAKVDELMALCDRLEAQQQERETRHAALARASLARFADAPTPANLNFLFHPSYAIPPADLRKSILTLAVQGKLVPQDPNDEHAEELAAELARLKTQLLADRRIRNQKVSGCPSEDDFPFEIPASWKWVRLGHAVTLLGGYAYESGAYVRTSSNQIIRLGNVKSDALLLDQKPAFIPDALAEQTAEYAILEGDILVTMTGTKAKRDYAFTLAVKRADLGGRRLFLNQRVGAIRPFQRELVPLINVFLKSDQLLDLVFATATGTANQANIGTSSILDLPFPLPPLAEQRRIVAKVEQLMALVDALETQLAASRATAANLLSALGAELT